MGVNWSDLWSDFRKLIFENMRIAFFESPEGKTLFELLYEHYEAFRKWALDAHQKSVWYEGKDFLDELTFNFLERNESLKSIILFQQTQVDIDRLTHGFMGYCTWGTGYTILNEVWSAFKFSKTSELIKDMEDEEAIRIWNHIIYGRSLLDKPFISKDNYAYFGYLTYKERKYLEIAIAKYCGELDSFEKRFWNRQRIEKKYDKDKDYWIVEDVMKIIHFLSQCRYSGEALFDFG
jgi:hypothetical protein